MCYCFLFLLKIRTKLLKIRLIGKFILGKQKWIIPSLYYIGEVIKQMNVLFA